MPSDDPDTLVYVRGAAARDLAMGTFVLWSAVAGSVPAMKAALLACAAAPLADFALAARSRGAGPSLFLHGAGVAGIVAAYALVSLDEA